MNITEENELKGSLFISAFDELIDSVGKEAETETEHVLDITFAAIGAASSLAMLAVDPFGTILGAGIGWLIEHLVFLREPLDMLMGDPDDINANVEAHKAQAAEMRVLAEDHRKGLTNVDGWSGQSAESFQKNMEQLGSELDSLANSVETKAKIVAICGMLVQVLRD
ncbi:WXG100 family type VII secretion target, partial [Actinosynnema sp.]